MTAVVDGTAGAAEAATLIERNRRRRRVRRRIGIASIPIVLAALLLVVKLLSMFAFAHDAIVANAEKNDTGTVRSAEWMSYLNWFEPYKAPYARGVGLASGGDLDGARAAFEEALPLTSGVDSCAVALNLTLVIEMQGDAAAKSGDRDLARARWTKALDIANGMPEVCGTAEASQRSPDPRRDLPVETEDTIARILEKLNLPDPPPPPPSDGDQDDPPPPPQTPQEKLDQLEELLQQGQQERDGLNQDGQGGGGAERPW